MTHQNADHATSSRDRLKTDNLLTVFFAVAALAILAACAYLLWLYPITRDLWSMTLFRATDNAPNIFEFYQRQFLRANPRVGEILFYVASGDRVLTASVGTASIAALYYFAGSLAVGRPLLFREPMDMAAVLIIFAFSMLASNEAGSMLFYLPFNSNYVAGYAVLLAFLLPYRMAHVGATLPNKIWLFVLPAGLLAGLSNEHTVPAYIGLLAAGGLASLLIARKTLANWQVTGWLALALGYALLFFAPGQSRRYGGVKYDRFDPDAMIAQLGRMGDILASQSIPALWIAGLIGAAAILALTRGPRRPEHAGIALTALLAALTGVGMALTLLPSPQLGGRLLFASQVNFGITVAACVLLLPPLARAVAASVSVVYLAIFISQANFWIDQYNTAFIERSNLARAQVMAGASHIIVPPYEIDFNEGSRFIIRDTNFDSADPNTSRNRHIARYYGSDTASVGPLDD